MANETGTTAGKTEAVVIGGGCFWCTEAVFLDVKGVTAVESAYAGGHVQNPSYEQICDGDTGHAEVVRVEFDPQQISLRQILSIFFATHDPTTLNRQGNDSGTQYRSVIFYANDAQREEAQSLIGQLTRDQVFGRRIVTEVSPLTNYFVAEKYHQRYYANNPHQGYCMMVVGPKVSKFRKQFASLLRK
jgi:peptide-methionine (S)-S-oxide reductase